MHALPPRRLVVVAAACWLACGTAAADRRPAPRPLTQSARADAAYAAGRYAEAAALYQKLLDVDTSSRTLFRTAEAYRLAGDRRTALFYLDSYLTVFPRGDHADEVRGRLESMRLEGVPVETPVAPEPAPVPAPSTRSAPASAPEANVVTTTAPPGAGNTRRLRDAALGVGVAALALGVAGAGLLGSVPGPYDQLRLDCRARACTPDDWHAPQTRAYAGYAVLAVAGAALVIDIPLWILWSRARRGAR